jgi:phosphoserine phosphatase RsbU/P
VSTDPNLLDRLLKLSAFDGDSAAALRSLHAFFSHEFPSCSLALLLVHGQGSGRCRLAGLIGSDGVEHIANDDPTGSHTKLPLFTDRLAARIFSSRQAHVVELAPTDVALPLAQALLCPAALLALPIVDSGAVTHWLAVGSTLHERFVHVDVERALVAVNLAASMVIRPLALRALTEQTKRQRNEIADLADIQKLLLPDNPKINGLDYAIHWQPAATAAGDYYDLMSLTHLSPADFRHENADIWACMLADVSGHGAGAAMEAVQFDAILRTYVGDGEAGPAGALTYANRHFFSRRQRGHFLTALALLYRPDRPQIIYVSAGHPPLLLRRGDTIAMHGEGEQIPLGVLREHAWQNREIAVERGDLLVLYTDGIIEARNADGEPFGADRLSAVVAAATPQARATLNAIVDAVFSHQGERIGSDDQTVIVLRIDH